MSTTVPQVHEGSTSSFPTHLSPMTPLQVMALQLPDFNTSDPSAFSSRTSADNASTCCLCPRTTHVTLFCNLMQEQLHTLLINHQRTPGLPGLPSCCRKQLTYHRKEILHYQLGGTNRFSHPYCRIQSHQLQAHRRQRRLHQLSLGSRRKKEDGGKTDEAFQKPRPSLRLRQLQRVDDNHQQYHRRQNHKYSPTRTLT